MSPLIRSAAGLIAAVLLAAATGCSDGSAPAARTTATPSPGSQLVAQLDALPTVDGATETAHHETAESATRSYRVPAGTPACLQVLARLDAGGYEVVAGTSSDAVAASTCLTTAATDPVATDTGQATILAAGGSSIALVWTATTYTLTATES